MKKGKGHVVQHVSHKNAEKKKEKKFWKGKNAKVSFKKSGFTSVPETEESSGMKPKFQGKCKFVTFLDISKHIALSSKTG